MRKRSTLRGAIPDKARDFADRIGDGIRHAVPDGAGKWLHDAPRSAGHWLQGVPDGAGKWLQAGVALGAMRTGARAAGQVARRHPVALTAAAVGIGAALYAVARHRRKKAEQVKVMAGDRSQRIKDALEGEGLDPHAGDLGMRPSLDEGPVDRA